MIADATHRLLNLELVEIVRQRNQLIRISFRLKTKKSATLTNQIRLDETEHGKELSYYFLAPKPNKMIYIPYTTWSAFLFLICILNLHIWTKNLTFSP